MTIARWRDIWGRFAGRGVYPNELAFLLDTRLRNLLISPQQLAEHPHLSSGNRVLEIGPGPGFFSQAVARRLRGEDARGIAGGRLVLFDIQSEMLVKSRRKLERAHIDNADYAQGNAVRLPFHAQAFDVVFLVTVLGEVPEPRECVVEISRVLRGGGILSVTEMAGDPDALGVDDLAQLGAPCGLELVERFPVRGGFTVNLRKVAGEGGTTGAERPDGAELHRS
jgi:SAM-dependent methyltransferase